MSQQIKTNVLVVGGGPGGYVAAIRCGQLGLDTVLVEADRLGGACLNRGCIPSKALIHVAGQFEAMSHAASAGGRYGVSLPGGPQIDLAATVAWKNGLVAKLNSGVAGLLKRAKVRVIEGYARVSDAKTCSVETSQGALRLTADHVILATGSRPVEAPSFPFGGRVISSTEALDLPEPPKRLVVVGAGYIGLELGVAFRKLGCEVQIIEAQSRILPLYDEELVRPVRRWLESHGVQVRLDSRALGLEGDGLAIEGADGERTVAPADRVLVTIGRRPNTEGWGLENMAVAMDGRFVRVDEQCRTSMAGVFAIGDLVGEPMLAHKASAQGEMVAEIIAGRRRRFAPACIPSVCFTEPEIAVAGLLPEQAVARGEDVVVASFPFQASGRALSTGGGDEGGFVRIVARKADHRVLGVQAVGAHVAELSAEFAHSIEMGAVLEDVAGTIHVHPTLSEAYHESALRALGHAIHV